MFTPKTPEGEIWRQASFRIAIMKYPEPACQSILHISNNEDGCWWEGKARLIVVVGLIDNYSG